MPSKYVLKAGVLLQAFSDASKTCTSKNITDELAEWHLKNNPNNIKYFAVLPGDFSDASKPRSQPTIIIPAKKEEPVQIPSIVGDFIKSTEPEKALEVKKEKPYKRKK